VAGIWLFVRGSDSIRILLRQDEQGLRVLGPGLSRQEYAFGDPGARIAFQHNLEQQLAAAGWTLQQFSDRRSRFERRVSPRDHARDRRDASPGPAEAGPDEPTPAKRSSA
jgi:hypothetical protein